MKTVLLDNNMYIMTQAPEKGEEPCLPHGLSMVNAYTEIATGSRHVTIVIKNQTGSLIIIDTVVKVTWVLLKQLDLSGLEGWSCINCASIHALLNEYHDIFLVGPGELGCMGLV